MKNAPSDPTSQIDECRPVAIYKDVDPQSISAMPITLFEDHPLSFPEPGYSCTAELDNGQVVGVFFGTTTKRLSFFAGIEIPFGDRKAVEAILTESSLPEQKVAYRWDEDNPAEN